MTLAASTNSRSRIDSTWPRSSLASPAQPKTVSRMVSVTARSHTGVSSLEGTRNWSTTGVNAMMNRICGNDSIRSMTRPMK